MCQTPPDGASTVRTVNRLVGVYGQFVLMKSGEAGFTFVVLLVCTILIVGALTFLPALALGPIVEHFLMRGTAPLY